MEAARAAIKPERQKKWKYPGPLALEEFLTAVATGPGQLPLYSNEWKRLSGISEYASQAHEHRCLCETLRLAALVDGVNVLNCSFAENICRRLIQIERAVSRNPKAPDFTGLDIITAVGIDAKGTAHAGAFSDYITEKQKSEAFTLKQTRLFAEEQGKLKQQTPGNINPFQQGDGEKARRPRPPKKGAKKTEG